MSKPHKRQGRLWWILVLLAVAIAVCILRLLIDRTPQGEVSLAWPQAGPQGWAVFRWTALAVAAIVGCSLSTSGVMLQALLRNPLASPFILGLSAGAGLGVMIAMYIASETPGVGDQMRVDAVPALVGALGVMCIVYLLAQRGGVLDPLTLILVGVIVSAICGAGIMCVQFLVPTGTRGEFMGWLMGSIPQIVSGPTLVIAGGIALGGVLIGLLMGRAMDTASLSDAEARSVGLWIGWLRLLLFCVAGILTAMTVAIAGPIAFVGLVAPHVGRLLLGPRHGGLVVGSALIGIALVVGADAARQGLDLGAGRMPIGVFTALLGGPLFLWLLLSGRGQA